MSELVKKVPIKLDRTRHLRLTLADAKRFKDRTVSERHPQGISMLGGFRVEALTEDEWLTLFVCCLEHEDPDLTEETLGEIVDMHHFHTILGKILTELLPNFLPEPREEAGDGDGGSDDDEGPPRAGIKPE